MTVHARTMLTWSVLIAAAAILGTVMSRLPEWVHTSLLWAVVAGITLAIALRLPGLLTVLNLTTVIPPLAGFAILAMGAIRGGYGPELVPFAGVAAYTALLAAYWKTKATQSSTQTDTDARKAQVSTGSDKPNAESTDKSTEQR
ncbi:hypothetical protein [Allonocardiopsis opalescens]|uniref:Uncharacterized protein n=1 Tax=Allonocardiopsis opalescens TaxID=1144618 RepID=A0A2T0PSU7_9ACTN|nr:hypothetical protein [Allonocardiopsis opalescens]PRX91970.1 hypothetical protein CLV72_11243 [Allonocardiopsis opalescens]